MFSAVARLTDLSLSRARLPRASVPDTLKLAKDEGLQARASVRSRVGCSEKLGRSRPPRLKAPTHTLHGTQFGV